MDRSGHWTQEGRVVETSAEGSLTGNGPMATLFAGGVGLRTTIPRWIPGLAKRDLSGGAWAKRKGRVYVLLYGKVTHTPTRLAASGKSYSRAGIAI